MSRKPLTRGAIVLAGSVIAVIVIVIALFSPDWLRRTATPTEGGPVPDASSGRHTVPQRATIHKPPAQTTTAETAESPSSGFAIMGSVVDPTGESVANALVSCWVSESIQTAPMSSGDITAPRDLDSAPVSASSTDAQGRFRLSPLDRREYVVRAAKSGYGPKELERVHPGENVVLVLDRGATILGEVLDFGALEPPQTFHVVVLSDDFREWAIVDADGSFAVWGVPDGTAAVLLQSASHPLQQRFVEVRGAAEYHVSFAVPREGGTVNGVVVDAESEEPIEGALVIPVREPLKRTRTDESGAFILPGAPQDATVMIILVSADHYAAAQVAVRGSTPGLVEIKLSRGAFLVGGVVDEKTGDAVPKVKVEGTQQFHDDVGARPARIVREGVTDSDGRFRIGPFRTGELVTLLFGTVDGAIALAQISAPASLAGDTSVRGIDIGNIALASPAPLSGRVEDAQGAPVGSAVVSVAPRRIAYIGREGQITKEYDPGLWGVHPKLRTDAEGRFAIALQSEADHVVRISASGFVSARLEVALPVEGLEVQVSLRGFFTKPLLVHVADAWNESIRTARVRLVFGGRTSGGETDEDGVFREDTAPAGTAFLSVAGTGYLEQQSTVELSEDEQTVEVQLVGKYGITGALPSSLGISEVRIGKPGVEGPYVSAKLQGDRFIASGIPPGTFVVRGYSKDGSLVASRVVKVGDQDVGDLLLESVR